MCNELNVRCESQDDDRKMSRNENLNENLNFDRNFSVSIAISILMCKIAKQRVPSIRASNNRRASKFQLLVRRKSDPKNVKSETFLSRQTRQTCGYSGRSREKRLLCLGKRTVKQSLLNSHCLFAGRNLMISRIIWMRR